MKLLQCDQYGEVNEVVSLVEAPKPPIPNHNEVLIDVEYASVSHAVGLMVQGQYQTRPPVPFTPGTEAVGTVSAVGKDVTHVKIGDCVLATNNWGCYAQCITVPAATVYPIPDGLDTLSALPIAISYGTAYTGLVWRCNIQPSDTLLVLGAGAGVGLAAVEIAVRLGARVIACASTEEKRQAALSRGAFAAIAPSADLAKQVKKLTDGAGVDIVVDPVGGELAGYALRATAANGQILSIGFASGTLPNYAPNYLLVKNITLHGFFYGRFIGWTPANEREVHAPAMQRAIKTLLAWARDGHLQPTVEKVYPMSALANALEALKSRQVIGKLALSILEETSV